MKGAINLITALSCMVIAAGFFSRDNIFVGIVIAAVGVFYVYKAVAENRRPAPPAETSRRIPTDAETAALRAELEGSLVDFRNRKKFTRSLFILLAGTAAFVFITVDNQALGLAICPFALGAGWLYYRNAKAVQLLEDNL